MQVIYIYALIDPRNKKVFYVGATKNVEARISEHVNNRLDNPRYELIEEIKKSGKNILHKILRETDLLNVDFWERFYFELYKMRKHPLIQSEHKFCYRKKNSIYFQPLI